MRRSLVLALFAIALMADDAADYSGWMKDAGATVQSLKKNLDSSNGAAAAADAKKLSEIFEQVHGFWAARNAEDAMKFAMTAQNDFAKASSAAEAGNLKEAGEAFQSATATCKGCHSVHRVKAADGSWKIQ